MSWIAWIVLGAIAGWVASMIMGTNARQGLLTDILVGIVGSVLGGAIFNFFGSAGVTGIDLRSFIVALIGSCALLAITKFVRSLGHRRT